MSEPRRASERPAGSQRGKGEGEGEGRDRNALSLEQTRPFPVDAEKAEQLEESDEDADDAEDVGAVGGDRDGHDCEGRGEGAEVRVEKGGWSGGWMERRMDAGWCVRL